MAMQYVGENTGKMKSMIFECNSAGPCAVTVDLDFDEEAESHVVLYSRLMHYLRGGEESSDGDFVEHRQPCELGKWLQHEGAARFGQLQSFCQLRDMHQQFHRDAEVALALLHAGSWKAAEQLCKRELSLSLRRVLVAITALNETTRKQGVPAVN
jgi:hypothetical protein